MIRRLGPLILLFASLTCAPAWGREVVGADGSIASAPSDTPDAELISSAGPAGGGGAKPAPARPFTDEDLLLFEVRAEEILLTDAFALYAGADGLYAPVGALARLIDAPVDVDAATGRIEGGAPGAEVRFDPETGRGVARGRELRAPSRALLLKDGDLYAPLWLAQALLGVEARADVSSLTLELIVPRDSEFRRRIERAARRAALSGQASDAPDGVVRLETPYALWTAPGVDLNLELEAGSASGEIEGGFDLRLAGDLFFAGVELFAGAGSDLELDAARLVFTRKDPQGRAAGPFGTRRAALGDAFSPGLSLGPRPASGRGLVLSSMPLDRASVFQSTDLRGELPLGYEVELYVNGVLRGAQAADGQGRYDFSDVPLAYGLNVVRLAFYGPRGERREEVRRINLDGARAREGETVFAFAAVEEGRTVLGLGDQEDLGWRVVAEVAHGLPGGATLTAGAAGFTPQGGSSRAMATAGLSGSTAGFAVQADLAADDRGGVAAALGGAGRIGGFSLTGRHAEYRDGFVDETHSAASAAFPLRRATSVQIDGALPLAGGALPVSLRASRDEYEDGRRFAGVSARTTVPVSRYLVSASVDYGQGPDGARQAFGTVDVTGLDRFGWQVRASAAYELLPDARLSGLTVYADRFDGRDGALRLAASHNFGAGDTSVQAARTWRLDAADVSLFAGWYGARDDFRVGLRVNLGFGRSPFTGRYRSTGPGAASGGALAVRAFLDRDGDGVRGADEAPLPGLVVHGGRRSLTTDAEGEAVVTGLGDGAEATVSIDGSGLEDPFLTLAATGYALTPRPGRTAVAELAVAPTGEAELAVLFVEPGREPRPVAGVEVELVDGRGAIRASGRSAFDGTVLLSAVPAGAYRVRLAEDQGARLGLAIIGEPRVTVAGDGGFAGRVEVFVQRKDAAR